MASKSIVVHGIWLLAAAGAFAAGRYLIPADGDAAGASGADSRKVVSVRDATLSGNGSAGDAGADSATGVLARDVAAFIDRYRVAGKGGLNEAGMSDAVREALRENDPVKSSLMFALLMEELTPENATAALEAVRETVSGMDEMRYLSLLSFKWGVLDGPGAVARAQEEGGRGGMFGTAIALAGWASTDADAALEWYNSQEDTDGRAQNFMLRGIISSLAASDPAAATRMVAEMAASEDADRGEVARHTDAIARQQLKNGIAGAEAWLNSLTDPNMRSGALDAISDHLSRQSPQEAAAWITRYADQEGSTRAISEVAEDWIRQDPDAAISWVSSLPAGEAQGSAMREAFQDWTREDPTAASQYLAAMPSSQAKDNAIAGLVRSTVREEPDAAMTWAASIADPAIRQETLVPVGSMWLRRDEAAATEWIANSGLSPDEQTAIITYQPQRDDSDRFRGGWDGGQWRGR